MVTAEYVPESGDFIWISLDPQMGHEQAGRRPVLVLSPVAYNAKTSMLIGVPVTTKRKGYPFQVELSDAGPVTGGVMADQVRCFDWRARPIEFAAASDRDTLRDVRALIATLIILR